MNDEQLIIELKNITGKTLNFEDIDEEVINNLRLNGDVFLASTLLQKRWEWLKDQRLNGKRQLKSLVERERRGSLGLFLKCGICGKEFEKFRKRKYCSDACSYKAYRESVKRSVEKRKKCKKKINKKRTLLYIPL